MTQQSIPCGAVMKERPILFNTEMVRAILDKRKTQSRRVIKTVDYGLKNPCVRNKRNYIELSPDGLIWRPVGGEGDKPFPLERFGEYCPFGQVGDTLYVRESFTYWEDDEFGGDYIEYRTGHRRSLGEWEYPHPIYDHCIGRFDKWTPSIHAPKWVSRITLEITKIKVERLQDISAEDAIAEGVESSSPCGGCGESRWGNCIGCQHPWDDNPITVFASLWDSIYADKTPWSSNPFVWAIEFKRVTN